jgi:hypothetical protein
VLLPNVSTNRLTGQGGGTFCRLTGVTYSIRLNPRGVNFKRTDALHDTM